MTDAWQQETTEPLSADPPTTRPAAAGVRVTAPPRMAAPPAVRHVGRPAGAGAPDGMGETGEGESAGYASGGIVTAAPVLGETGCTLTVPRPTPEQAEALRRRFAEAMKGPLMVLHDPVDEVSIRADERAKVAEEIARHIDEAADMAKDPHYRAAYAAAANAARQHIAARSTREDTDRG